jgi:hypothetical protein
MQPFHVRLTQTGSSWTVAINGDREIVEREILLRQVNHILALSVRDCPVDFMLGNRHLQGIPANALAQFQDYLDMVYPELKTNAGTFSNRQD